MCVRTIIADFYFMTIKALLCVWKKHHRPPHRMSRAFMFPPCLITEDKRHLNGADFFLLLLLFTIETSNYTNCRKSFAITKWKFFFFFFFACMKYDFQEIT